MIIACMTLFMSSSVAPLACLQPPPPPPAVVTARAPERPYGLAEPVTVPEPWLSLAVCESGWYGEPRWDYNGDSGFDGGVQFHPRTWTAFGGDEFAPYAYQAAPMEQIEVARRVLAEQGWGAWPTCSEKLGLR